MKGKGVAIGEFIYGILALILGFPTFESVLAQEILSQTTGSLHSILWVLFALIFITGIIGLIDFILRWFNKTFADVMNGLIEEIESYFSNEPTY